MKKYRSIHFFESEHDLTGSDLDFKEFYLASEADAEIAKRDARIVLLETAIQAAIENMYGHDVFQELQKVLHLSL